MTDYDTNNDWTVMDWMLFLGIILSAIVIVLLLGFVLWLFFGYLPSVL